MNISSGPAVASLFHWDRTAWTNVLSNLQEPLNGIWGSSPTDVWTVGNRGLSLIGMEVPGRHTPVAQHSHLAPYGDRVRVMYGLSEME